MSNEFELIRTSEGNHIRARLTAESIHIAALVSSQNRSKRRKSTKPAAFIPRSNIQLDNNNWNHTANSKVSADSPFFEQHCDERERESISLTFSFGQFVGLFFGIFFLRKTNFSSQILTTLQSHVYIFY